MKKIKTKNKVKLNNLELLRQRELMHDRFVFCVQNDCAKVLEKFNSSKQGLIAEQVELNREEYGENVMATGQEKTIFKKLAEAFINPFTAILLFIALVSGVTDIVIPMMNKAYEDIQPLTVIIIITMVMISGILKFVQEMRSDKASEKLLEMITTTCCVERFETHKEEIPIDEVVVGDIVHLAAGDMIPADLRILEAKDLFISQSALTGESDVIEKTTAPINANYDSVIEYTNLAFMGSNVISGSASAVVVAVGDDTMFGDIALSLSDEKVETSFSKGVNEVSHLLIRFMLVMVPIVFILNGITKRDWVSAFVFSISIAVGLTPEMLPMIVTTCLAKGAVAMSKKKTIVKDLNSIQNFGAIDILCTDKTGTLTQDRVALQYHLNVNGEEDLRILRHAYLNSYFQTGYKNLMDKAIINKANEELGTTVVGRIHENHRKVDEIPFDFARRRLSVVVCDQKGKTQLITKGAVEEMLSICSFVEYKGQIDELTEEFKIKILDTVDKLNDDGMRVIAIAQKNNPAAVGAFGVNDESDMVLMGYLAFLDPPKETTSAAIKALASYGVTTKILTGDNDKVTRAICKQVGLDVEELLLGSDIDLMDDVDLAEISEKVTVFAKLSPTQKARVVSVLRDKGHAVGFLGDGINDAPAMKAADIGISVDTAVDIAKESADIILLEKDLMVLEEGIIEGRKTYANMIKYIKMTSSSNFGNMFSVLAASAFLPFLPMQSIHLIFLNLIYDLSCAAIPWDNVDDEFLRKPKKWGATTIKQFMLWIGPTSSIFDWLTYIVLYFVICPKFVSNGLLFHHISPNTIIESGMYAGMNMQLAYVALFQTGWFVESMWTQTLVIHMIRTEKIPFVESRASGQLTMLTTLGIAALTIIPFTPLGTALGLVKLPATYFVFLIAVVAMYVTLTTVVKKAYIKKFGELL